MVEFSTGKSLIILATVIGCFAILWPKIFYPLLSFTASFSRDEKDDSSINSGVRHHPQMHLPARMREAIGEVSSNMGIRNIHRDARPFPHPNARQGHMKSTPKTGGTMGIVMPIYTIAIVGFFLYTILKLIFKKNPEDDPNDDEPSPYSRLQMQASASLLKNGYKDILTNPSSFTAQLNQSHHALSKSKMKTQCAESKTGKILKDFGKQKEECFDNQKDYEIFELRQKLLETERRMEEVLKSLGGQPFGQCSADGNLRGTSKEQMKEVDKAHKEKEAELIKGLTALFNSPNQEEAEEEDETPKSEEIEESASDVMYDTNSKPFKDEETDSNGEGTDYESDGIASDDIDETTGLRQRVKDLYKEDSKPPSEEEGSTYRQKHSCNYADILKF